MAVSASGFNSVHIQYPFSLFIQPVPCQFPPFPFDRRTLPAAPFYINACSSHRGFPVALRVVAEDGQYVVGSLERRMGREMVATVVFCRDGDSSLGLLLFSQPKTRETELMTFN